ELRAKTQNHRLKCVSRQLSALAERLENASQLGSCTVKRQNGELAFRYRNRSLRVKQGSSAGRLLMLLVKERKVAKGDIIKAIYRRDYTSDTDDGLVYYQMHSLRRQLAKTGLPPEAIQTSNGFYLWKPALQEAAEPETEENP